MAGYFIYSLDGPAFDQLTTNPKKEQTSVLADVLLESYDDTVGELKKKERALWPRDREQLADAIGKRLASPDWYSDLSEEAAVEVWNQIVFSLRDEAGEKLGVGFHVYDYESVYWDCAQMAADEGATSMQEPTFGSSGFRYFGKPGDDYPILIYSIFPNERTKALLAELEAVVPAFEALEDESEGSPREQFFEGLLPSVKHAAENGRALFVQTDT